MPKPVHEELLKYAEHQNPRSRMILETVVVTSEDVKDTKADWDDADSTTGWTTLEEGGATPTGTLTARVTYDDAGATADVITSMPGISGASVGVAVVEWNPGSFGPIEDINSVIARLDPDADGVSGVNVSKWVCQLFRVAKVSFNGNIGDLEQWELEALTQPLKVTAGATVADVTFLFPVVGGAIGTPPDTSNVINGAIPDVGDRPTTVVVISALDANGDTATNVAWIGDNTISTTSNNGNNVTRFTLSDVDTDFSSQTVHTKAQAGPVNGLPRVTLRGRNHTQQTIAFTGANAPALAATPTGTVEFIVEHEQPANSSGQGYVRNNGSTAWVSFTDGQTVADLAGVSTTGPVYEMQYIATPSTAGFDVPTVRRLGVRELTRETLDGIARIGNPVYQLDPFNLKAAIPTLPIELTRDGVRDYRDFVTELFSDNHAGKIEFRVWYGHPDLDRQHWVHIDQFRMLDYETASESVVVETIHPLALVKKAIPTGTTSGQNAVVFSGATDTTATAYASILNTVGVAARYKGVLLGTTATTKVSKTIGKPRPAKDELDRLAFIEGGAIIPSGGRMKWKRIWTSTGGLVNSPVAHFDNITPVSVSPNLHRRIISFRAPYGYDEDLDSGRGGFSGASLQQSTSAISKLGHASLDAVQDLEDETAKWLINDSTSVGSVHAEAIARRTVSAYKSGAVVVAFRSDHPKPWLELGDTVEVKTDRYIGKGLESDRALRGRMSVTGPIIQHDMNGTEFSVLVPDIDSSVLAPTPIAIDYGFPIIVPTEQRQVSAAPSNGNQRFFRDVTVVPNKSCKSYRVSYSFLRFAGSTSPPSNLSAAYNVDVTTPGTIESHRLQTSTGGTQAFIIQQSTSGPKKDTGFGCSFVPYSKVGGSTGTGVAGAAKIIACDALDASDYVGVRAKISGTTYTLGGHRFVAGTGITLSWTTGGDIQISST